MDLELHYDRPTSIFIGGEDRATLNWCALTLAPRFDPEFFWTDVRMEGEQLDPRDPLAAALIPPDRFHQVAPPTMSRDERSAEIARSRSGELLRADDRSDARTRLVGFLGLPAHTQEILPGGPGRKAPRCVVLSNAHRLVALYPTGSVEPTVRAIVEYGATLITTFADAAPEGRWAFDTVLRISGRDPAQWKASLVTVERLGGGPRRDPPVQVPLKDFPPIAARLTR